MNADLKPVFDRVQRGALGVGVIALIISAVGAYLTPARFLQSYLVAFWYWLAVALGCLALFMLQSIVKGEWGFLLRRPMEAGSRTLPLMVILFIPILGNLGRLYPWAAPETVASLNLPPFKREYLQTPFWVARAILYFATLLLWAFLMNRWSAREDAGAGSKAWDRMRVLSGPGLAVFSLIVSFAAVDWVMSLEPGFFSTIYGMIFMVIPALLGVALSVIVLTLLSGHSPVAGLATPERFNNYGNLMLVFTMLWAYLQFDQFLIIWAGNLQDEIPWYVTRARGVWGGVAVALFLFHFALPFLCLLQRVVTRGMKWLALVSALLMVMEWVDLYWMIAPAFSPHGPNLSWMDLTLFLGVGGLWVSWFTWQLKSRPLLPLHDPRFNREVISVGS